ncbi:uncharacterized protein [Mytilus edulis]|uniref:uncharacterized protein n=1 Tax=Mytilus edulis TaxID=6550 RepID=UPI0039EF45C6
MRYFVFNVLPFGIATAGYIFTKVLREVVKHMRAEGKRVMMFLDDGLGGDNDFENCMNSSFEVKNTLERLGFLIAHEKCHLLPSQSMDWLGYTWDTKIGRVFIKEERIEKAENSIHKLCREATNGRLLFSARFLASILGQIISMMIVIGDKVRLHTRYLYDCIMGRASWVAPVKMNPDALTEILFWESSLRKLNEQGVDICRVDHDFVSDFDIFCDASDVGFGGYLSTQFSVVTCVDNSEMSGNWTSDEKLESSTWRELKCARRVLCTYESKFSLDNKSVSINSDNKNVPHILKVGSKKSILQNIAVDIHNICSEKNITLNSKWLPRADNQYADKLSRNTDNDDWGIHGELFNYFNGTWGPYNIDRFATHYNTHCTRFNSKHWCPGSEGIDAFSQNWGKDTNWLVPPPSLVPMVLQKIQHDKAACVNLRRNVEAALVESGVSDDCNIYNLAGKMTTFLVDSRSENTCKKYYSSFNRWKKFAIENSLNELPAEPVHIALYITKLIDEQCSPSVNKPISYTAAKENIVKRLKLVAPSLNLGLHSLRSGGATAAKSNVNERCIKRHGRWKTDFSKDGYIEDTLEKRISVSQKLGL